ncbi:phosphoribosylanthranilate isomerase [Sulfuritalea hydrogenivorans]|uniref:N-(5'-phosphoribosyl)anthranilate isomerase n=1 Tax=Sulfuritalea hydrogenivorans sk43H TaxID=1223802 RepID=W0SH83_9PROT|nr:phosphoribosylanthranilate isomerase [Sulfuritalea hydrogenivorans]BAO29103.1 N-(5'-phosphoribosyl)anthranilate isomerase [Sulfuritalea hydrogenivorans sk43H]
MTRTRIKICGITREEDLAAAVAAGADALGFVFYAPSPRYVTIERAAQLMAQVPAFVTKVGLFVNAEPQAVRETMAQVPLDLLQFHGDEDAAYCAAFGRPWIKAARVRPGFDLLEYASLFAKAPGVSGLLLDAHVEGYGGGGKTFDWTLIPRNLSLPVILSGGLHPGNVAEAVRTVRPWAVDVSSGVEAARGIKDAQKIIEFIAGVREADAGPSL